MEIGELTLHLERYISERDDARKAVCELTSRLNQELGAETLSPKQTAKQLGWSYLYTNNKETQ